MEWLRPVYLATTQSAIVQAKGAVYGDDENAPRSRDSPSCLASVRFLRAVPIRQDNAIAGRAAPTLGEREVQAMLSSVLALCTAAPGAVLTAAALDSAAAAVAGAASTVIINGEGPYEEFWSKIPSMPSSYTVAAGTVLSFRYTSGHNVWLMPTEQAFNDCDFSAAVELASQTYGGGQPPIWPNDYKAVATLAGDLLIACRLLASHHGRGKRYE